MLLQFTSFHSNGFIQMRPSPTNQNFPVEILSTPTYLESYHRGVVAELLSEEAHIILLGGIRGATSTRRSKNAAAPGAWTDGSRRVHSWFVPCLL